jgi:predicted dehydrogenase
MSKLENVLRNKDKPVKIAVIGCGGYAFQLMLRMWTIPRYIEIVAATSRNPMSENARICAARGIRIYSNIQELLADPPEGLQAVFNPTPIEVHAETTIPCLDAGFPVWLEKPPVPTLAEYDQLLPAIERSGQPVDVCFNSLYGCNLRKLKADLVAGVYGRIKRISGIGGWVRTESYFERNAWAGALKINGHWIYDGTINNPFAHVLCNNLFLAAKEELALAEPAEVEARLWRVHAIESEDTSSLRIVTRDGIEVFSHLTLAPEATVIPESVIDTEAARIVLSNFEVVDVHWHDGRKEHIRSFKENRVEMLEELAHRCGTDAPQLCSLAMCRPFTAVVESAFQQVLEKNGGSIPKVEASRILRRPEQGSSAISIHGINDKLRYAHENGVLLDL